MSHSYDSKVHLDDGDVALVIRADKTLETFTPGIDEVASSPIDIDDPIARLSIAVVSISESKWGLPIWRELKKMYREETTN